MRLLYVTWFFLSVAACSDGGQFVGQKPASDEKATSDDEGDEEAEATSQPIPVSAAYLTCDVSAEDASSADELVYGCRLASQATRRSIDLSKIANKWSWDIGPLNPSTVKAYVQEKDAQNGGFQALYRFTGGESAAVRESAAKSADIKLDMALKKPIAGFDGFKSDINSALVSDAKVKKEAAQQTAAPTITQPATTVPGNTTGPDADGDGVTDLSDLCAGTKPGEAVWKEGEWMGCAEGQHRNSDDGDADRVANTIDICPSTPAGATVDDTEGSPTRGCAANEQPPF